jgi:hypothetical protein
MPTAQDVSRAVSLARELPNWLPAAQLCGEKAALTFDADFQSVPARNWHDICCPIFGLELREICHVTLRA